MIKYIYKIKWRKKSVNYKKKDKIKYGSSPMYNLIPRVLSYRPTERETLENAGHVSPRIWEIKNKWFGGGAGKCEICLCRA